MIVTITLSMIAFLFVVALVQQQCKRRKWTPPSAYVSRVANQAIRFFEWVGAQLAFIGTFFVRFKDAIAEYLSDLLPSIVEVLQPVAQLVFSPLYIIKGYFDQVAVFIRARWTKIKFEEQRCLDVMLLVVGSLVLITAISVCLLYFVRYQEFVQIQQWCLQLAIVQSVQDTTAQLWSKWVHPLVVVQE